ncbi:MULTISPECIES: hypothetical protein [unclassified Mycobacterium]|uniref:hypothetical protein n=1 Tax=unclassified Mycobacterium TaxID=2642494 RepID=UPI0014818030|nr:MULTISPECIES: hypothetical protein [unclassified Mycobacterium]
MATSAPAGAVRDHAGTKGCAAMRPDGVEARRWSGRWRGLRRGNAADEHGSGERAGAYRACGGVTHGSQ